MINIDLELINKKIDCVLEGESNIMRIQDMHQHCDYAHTDGSEWRNKALKLISGKEN